MRYDEVPEKICRKCRYSEDGHPLVWRWEKRIGGSLEGDVYCIRYAIKWLRKIRTEWVWRRRIKIERTNHNQLELPLKYLPKMNVDN